MVSNAEALLNVVAYLHDARCLQITWDCGNPDVRSIRMKVIVDAEAGIPSWDGKTLLITLEDVVAARLTGWGYTIGDECIDSWKQGISDSLERDCRILVTKGISLPTLKFVISFRSGSELEVICSGASAIVLEEEKRTL
jgi:hypothetical protein